MSKAYTENCKTLLRESNEDLNKCRAIQCFMNKKTEYLPNIMYKN